MTLPEQILIPANVLNKNGRIYPSRVFDRLHGTTVSVYMVTNDELGELNPPMGSMIGTAVLSCKYGDVWATVTLLDTPRGSVMRELITNDPLRMVASPVGIGMIGHDGVVADNFTLKYVRMIPKETSAWHK